MAFSTKKFDVQSPEYSEIAVTIAGSAVVDGEFATINDVNGFYIGAHEVGDLATLVVKARKVKVEKNTPEAWTPGDSVYWDATGENVTIVSTSNTLIGHVNEAAASADTEGYITFEGYASFLKA